MTATAITDMPLEMRARTLSRRQRHNMLVELIKVPKHMVKLLKAPNTQKQADFIILWNWIEQGKEPMTGENLNLLKARLEEADKERWATKTVSEINI